jgi:hypothetical protein
MFVRHGATNQEPYSRLQTQIYTQKLNRLRFIPGGELCVAIEEDSTQRKLNEAPSQIIMLPASFAGSPRCLSQKYQ